MKARKKKRHLFLRVALLAFSVYVVVVLVQLQLEIRQKQTDIDTLTAQVEEQRIINEDLKRQTKQENLDENLEKQARNEGYAKSGEIIMTEVPGAADGAVNAE